MMNLKKLPEFDRYLEGTNPNNRIRYDTVDFDNNIKHGYVDYWNGYDLPPEAWTNQNSIRNWKSGYALAIMENQEWAELDTPDYVW